MAIELMVGPRGSSGIRGTMALVGSEGMVPADCGKSLYSTIVCCLTKIWHGDGDMMGGGGGGGEEGEARADVERGEAATGDEASGCGAGESNHCDSRLSC